MNKYLKGSTNRVRYFIELALVIIAWTTLLALIPSLKYPIHAIFFVLTVITAVRRGRDAGKPVGQVVVMMIIPYVQLFYMLYLFIPSTARLEHSQK